MAKHYASTTKTYTVRDTYTKSGQATRWSQIDLSITVDENGNGSWTSTATNDSSETGYGTYRVVFLEAYINGTAIAGKAAPGWPSSKYTYLREDQLSSDQLNSWPHKNGTSKSGTFTVSSDSFSVSMVLCCMQDYSSTRVDEDAELNKTFTRTMWEDSACSVEVVYNDTLKNKNKYQVKGTITPGTNNGLDSAMMYWTNDGSDPSSSSTRKSQSITATTTSSEQSVPTSSSSTIKAYLVCSFKHQNLAAGPVSKTVYYYADGTAPSTPTITNNKNNTYTISGNVGASGTNNNISSAKLNYTVADTAQTAKTLTTTSGGTYTYTFNTPTNAVSSEITAQVVRTMEWSGATVKNSSKATATIPYYAPIKTNPAVSITDNGNNTFTITGTNATGGNANNTLTTAYAWDYSTSYGNSGTGTKTLTIATPANATRTVYAKATATLSVYGDPATVTASANIKQYVAPGNPGTPVLSYSKSRLTIKEPWVFTWTAASPTNTSSPVAGYRLTLFKNGTSIPIKNSGGTDISRYVDSVYIYDTTSLSFTVDPVQNGFLPGDTVVLAVRPYTKTATGVCLYNANNTYSVATTVQNAGVVHVKQNSQWHEGQVWVKVAGTWKEAETVNVKVSGAWKESQ